MQTLFTQKFDQFVHSYIDQSTQDNRGLITLYDDDWKSPCIEAKVDNLLVNESEVDWIPTLRSPNASFQNIADALDMTIPEELSILLGRYFSLDLNAQTERGKLTLLQAWNAHDFERLQKNLIAHVLMKRKLKQQDTLFFALTDEEDYIISLVPSSGEVVLELVGKPPQEVLAHTLGDFLDEWVPLPTFVTL
ncbi:SecY-interacting protein [Agaribacter marinus]|uniref:Protein Syd n=1 Tax=Agaribacter marinus TaxID=1431249 RepID=A0AA37WIE4_9ALTE|nr:SecY-interacting protein [Agaribacter marinus]GLR70847.1 protein Syd [Agaribacter marinus]